MDIKPSYFKYSQKILTEFKTYDLPYERHYFCH